MLNCPNFDYLLVIPYLRVQNANAISSPLTHGFPAMSAFVGLMWALQRRVNKIGLALSIKAVGVVAHDYDEQTTKGRSVNVFHLTRNPIDKNGETAAIVEEGRIHLNISLLFALDGEELQDPARAQEIATQMTALVSDMRIAGGSVIPNMHTFRKKYSYIVPFTAKTEVREKLFKQLKMRLLPGSVLVERPNVLTQRHQQLQAENSNFSRLDAWLSLARINWHWQTEVGRSVKGKWQHDRQLLGWVVPIPVGYNALTKLQKAGSVANARDVATDFRFVENLYSIGQWLSPHRLQSPQQLLWYASTDAEAGIYRCCNDYEVESVRKLNPDCLPVT